MTNYIYRVAASDVTYFTVIFFIRIIHNSDDNISFLVCFSFFQKCNSETQPPPNLDRQKSQEKWEAISKQKKMASTTPLSSIPFYLMLISPSPSLFSSHDFHRALFWAVMVNWSHKPNQASLLCSETSAQAAPVSCSSSWLIPHFLGSKVFHSCVPLTEHNKKHVPKCHPPGSLFLLVLCTVIVTTICWTS